MKLASAERILSLNPIDGADNIEVATVLGWQVVVKKNEFKVGDLVAYIQIDTVVPDKPEFEFLRARDFRVRTIKLRKQVSQGLIVPLPQAHAIGVYHREGDDVTELFGIKKYEKEVAVDEPRRMPKKWYKKWIWIAKERFLVKLFPSLKQVNRRPFPSELVPITDEERIQNMPHMLDKCKGQMFVESEKLDGSSITVIHETATNWFRKKTTYRICSRRFELFNQNNEWRQVFVDTAFHRHIKCLVDFYETDNIIVQGEYIGKPQSNRYQLKQNEIRLFNIFVNGKRINQSEFYGVCQIYDIPCCPLLDIKPLDFDLPGILQYAEGKSKLNPTVEREGLVFRSANENSVSFKVISNKYLLKNNE